MCVCDKISICRGGLTGWVGGHIYPDYPNFFVYSLSQVRLVMLKINLLTY